MAILTNVGIRGSIHSLLVHAQDRSDITSVVVQSVDVSFAGFAGESHSGLTRESCVRVADQYSPGTIIRNTRQVSIVSAEELAVIAAAMGIDAIRPEWLGANLCLAGIPDLTLLPPSTRLIFSSGVSLVVDMENEPCKYPAQVIDSIYPGQGKLFVKSAMAKRGITAWVEKEGVLYASDSVVAHIPKQRRYEY